jgi:ribosomal protein S24E
MSTTTKSFFVRYVRIRFGITDKTGRLFIYKVREVMKSDENYLIKEIIDIDELVIDGKEVGKMERRKRL